MIKHVGHFTLAFGSSRRFRQDFPSCKRDTYFRRLCLSVTRLSFFIIAERKEIIWIVFPAKEISQASHVYFFFDGQTLQQTLVSHG